MKVKPNNLFYDFLPSKKDKKKLMADDGMPITDPRVGKGLKTLSDDYFSAFKPATPGLDQSFKKSNLDMIPVPQQLQPTYQAISNVPGTDHHEDDKTRVNWGDFALLGLGALDKIIPDQRAKQQITQPQLVQAQNPYGTGSQALYYGGKVGNPMYERDAPIIIPEGEGDNSVSAASGIHIKKSKRGSLHKALGIPEGKKIPASKLASKPGDSPAMKKKKVFARNAKKWHHEEGGIIPNNMTNFSPKEYSSGGNVSPEKAKEILRDGTAQGHKLTEKQKKYFGWIAGGGKAPDGIQLPNGDAKPWNGTGDQTRKLNLSELMSYNLVGKGNPDEMKKYKNALFTEASAQLGVDKARKLTNDINIFNQRSDLKGKSPEDRISAYYNILSNDNDIRGLKDQLKNFAGSPEQIYRTSPDINLQSQQTSTAKLDNGGVMYDDGGQVQTLWGGNVEQMSNNPHDGGTIKFNGASHADGGIGMHYNGKPVEVEGGETAAKDNKGNLNIFGNMYLPGTNTKFKTVMDEIGNKEKRYDFLKTKGSNLVNKSDVSDRFEKLAFNAGSVMMQGGSMGQKDLANKKQQLADLQKAMLDTAHEHGLDPQEMSKGNIKKAKMGDSISMFEDGGEPTMSDRNNNPGNIKYAGQKGAKKGPAAPDGGFYAVFPTRQAGFDAMKSQLNRPSYKNLTVKDAIQKWTGGHPYHHDLGELEGKKISELKPEELSTLMNTMTKGEGTKYGPTARLDTPNKFTNTNLTIPDAPKFTPYGLPNAPITPETSDTHTPITATPPNDQLPDTPDKKPIPTQAESLNMTNVLGEIYAAATNHQTPVFSQKYQPQLYTPYQVSFQDRLNQDQSTFNAVSRQLGNNNPSALGTLAGQKYAADNAIKGEEFRTNQGISSDINNKNINLENDAQLKNLGLADTQFVRQSTAASKTKELNQQIVNSLSSKYLQNQLENKKLQAYENLYDFRQTKGQDGVNREQYYGPDASFGWENRPNHYGQQGGQGDRSATRYDQYGNIKSVTQYKDDELKQRHQELANEIERRKLPLVSVPPLN